MVQNLASGTLLDDRFKIECLVGEGGMGKVYKATQLDLGRTVALKVMFPSTMGTNEARKRFIREGKILSELTPSANLPLFFHFAIWQGQTPYIAMEFLEGKSLREVLNTEDLYWWRTLRLIIQICDGLSILHQAGFIHRDLKPDNVVITQTGTSETAKVIDFGIAGIISDAEFDNLTKSGLLVGTANYMSPEQCKGQPASVFSDIYAIGCMLYECLSGAPPFTGDTPLAIMEKQAVAKLTSLRQASPTELPDKVISITERCLAKLPADRPGSVLEVKAILEEILDHNQQRNVRAKRRPRSKNTYVTIGYSIGLAGLLLSPFLMRKLSNNTFSAKGVHDSSKSSEPVWYRFYEANCRWREQVLNADEMIQSLDEIIADQPPRMPLPYVALAHIVKGEVLLGQGRKSQCEKECNIAIELLHHSPSARIVEGLSSRVLGELALSSGELEKSLRLLKQARLTTKQAPIYSFFPGRGDLDSIEPELKGGTGVIDGLIFKVFEKSGEHEASVEYFDTLVTSTADDKSASLWLSESLIHFGKFARAKAIIFQNLNEDLRDPAWLNVWLNLLYAQRRTGAAQEIMRHVGMVLDENLQVLISQDEKSPGLQLSGVRGPTSLMDGVKWTTLNRDLTNTCENLALNQLHQKNYYNAMRFTKMAFSANAKKWASPPLAASSTSERLRRLREIRLAQCGNNDLSSIPKIENQVVPFLYRQMLHRPPDAGGLGHWTCVVEKHGVNTAIDMLRTHEEYEDLWNNSVSLEPFFRNCRDVKNSVADSHPLLDDQEQRLLQQWWH